MSNEAMVNNLTNILNGLDDSQEKLEKDAFDVINSSDTSLNLVKESMSSVEEILGMIESMKQKTEATHVLLMDDDVEVLPESIIRTFNLLSLLNDEYSSAFLSGAMMSLEEQNLKTEDIGFFSVNGNFLPLKPEGRMDFLHDVVETEAFEAPLDTFGDTAQQYAGWWYLSLIHISSPRDCS